MPLPRPMKTARLALPLLLLCAPAAPPAAAQQTPQPEGTPPAASDAQAPPAATDADARRGEELLRRGDTKGAAKAIRAALKRHKEDPLLWLSLAQALVLRGELGEARKALDAALRLAPGLAPAHASLAYLHFLSGKDRDAEAEAGRALALDPRSVDAHYVLGLMRLREGAWLKAAGEADAILKLDGRASVAHLIKAEALLGLFERGEQVLGDERRGAYDFDEQTVAEARAAQPRRLEEAAASFEKYLQLRPDAPDAEELRGQIESLRLFARRGPAAADARVYTAKELITKALITAKPEPSFTEEARRARVNGVVRLRAVLAFDGRVRNIHVVRRLPYGLTEKAVAAARGIKFKPARVNGVPVSQWVTLEYNFNVY